LNRQDAKDAKGLFDKISLGDLGDLGVLAVQFSTLFDAY
jgi:hypothetical protein